MDWGELLSKAQSGDTKQRQDVMPKLQVSLVPIALLCCTCIVPTCIKRCLNLHSSLPGLCGECITGSQSSFGAARHH